MPILSRIADFHADMMAWRHDIHAHPEMAFKEHRTSDLVAAKLREFNIPIERGVAGTGVVGTLRCGSGERAIAIRAGNGPTTDGRYLHSARYDFNDEILPLGASYWCTLVDSVLRPR